MEFSGRQRQGKSGLTAGKRGAAIQYPGSPTPNCVQYRRPVTCVFRLITCVCRYIPSAEDSVVGLIIERYSESWRVDIAGPFSANLPALAFEGVTRRNRPNLQPGDLIYARVTAAPRDADPELACTDASGTASITAVLLFST